MKTSKPLKVVKRRKGGFIIKRGRRTIKLRFVTSFARKVDAEVVVFWLEKDK